MKKKKPEIMWAVKSEAGFYTGTWLYRSTAYTEHAKLTQLGEETHEATWNRRRKAHGDCIVKVQLVEVKLRRN